MVHHARSEALASDRVVARDNKLFKPLFAKQCLGAIRKVVAPFGAELGLDGEGDVLENAKRLREFVATSVHHVFCIHLHILLLKLWMWLLITTLFIQGRGQGQDRLQSSLPQRAQQSRPRAGFYYYH